MNKLIKKHAKIWGIISLLILMCSFFIIFYYPTQFGQLIVAIGSLLFFLTATLSIWLLVNIGWGKQNEKKDKK